GLLKEAQDQYRNVIESSPDFAYVYSRLGLALLKESRYEEAISEIQKSIDLPGNWEGAAPDLIYAYSLAGRKEEAQSLLAELQLKSTRQFIPNILLALGNAAAGDNEKAIEFLLKALAEKSNQLRPNINEPHFDRLRSDPRFQDLLKTIGIRMRKEMPPSV
ncbi:MAG TPA: tetratricopeptide repeat protein, partial [Candidatus Bathyarchaeia archaeon]|nr:tetratricopeptide repeat protein [Candidatus Bathyarchaeia archaeon]